MADPISKMAFSKSHIDRLFKAQALPSPPWPFTRQFLRITSRAAGLTAEQHRERLAAGQRLAQDLLAALEDTSSPRIAHLPAPRGGRTVDSVHEETIATLRLGVDLERARHTETRLRFALRDAQFRMTTLWSIVSALRDIIAGHDAAQVRVHHSSTDAAELVRLRDETRQAIDHKHAAQDEADRTAARIRALEGLWDQARADVHRLSMHPDAGDFTSPASDAALPPSVVPQDLLAQPALDDIAAALSKARALNSQEELVAVDLEHDVSSLRAGDELAILVAATRLSDRDNRRTALRTLCRDWPRHPETKEVLIRLVDDEDVVLRGLAADGLVQGWAGDPLVRDSLVGLLREGEELHVEAVDGLVQGWAGDAVLRDAFVRLSADGEDTYALVVLELAQRWAGDAVVRDLLVRLSAEGGTKVRHAAAQGLVDGWAGDTAIREVLGGLLTDDASSVRHVSTEALAKAWAGNAATCNVLVRLIHGADTSARHVAAQALLRGTSGTTAARDTVIKLSRDNNERIRRAAARVLVKGWPGDDAARDAVASLLSDSNQRVPRVAVRVLAQGWPGDDITRDALLVLAQHAHSDPRARRTAVHVLAEGWPGDATVKDALTRLTHEDVHAYVRRPAARLLADVS